MGFLICALALLSMAQPVKGEKKGANGEFSLRPVSSTPKSNAISLSIAVPKMGQVISDNPVWIQFRLDGYALGTDSPFDRTSEVANSKLGQTVHIIIDDHPYFPVREPALDPFDEEGYFYDTSYKIEIPFSLKEGGHVIRMFPARSFGESLKGKNAFQATYFYLGKRKDGAEIDLLLPYLTYNEPSDRFHYVEGKPILLDFYLSNCELTKEGYKVELTVDGKKNRLTSWQPYYLYLEKGSHKIGLKLIDGKGEQVPGSFNEVWRIIRVHSE